MDVSKSFFGWYKPKFEFSKLIWDSWHIPTLTLVIKKLPREPSPGIDFKTEQNLANFVQHVVDIITIL